VKSIANNKIRTPGAILLIGFNNYFSFYFLLMKIKLEKGTKMKIKNILMKLGSIIFNIIIVILLIIILSIVGFCIYYQINYKEYVDNILDNMSYDDFVLQNNQTVYFSNGEQMILYSPYQKETINNPSEITEIIKETTLAAEDERFYNHNGVDIKSIARAFISNLKSNSTTQGASTLTQQLVNLLI
jgi:membrane carboxypeptidase/penicillin-binding protein